jgi:TPR repeat protein
MAFGVMGGLIRLGIAGAALVSNPALAADVGGWFAEQQRAEAQAASNQGKQSCAQVIARAARDATAIGAYEAAHCYLQADPADLVAAKAWLSRSAEMNFLPAQRLLRSLLAAESGAHAALPHCHDLGEGRQICHGGAPPVAKAPAN